MIELLIYISILVSLCFGILVFILIGTVLNNIRLRGSQSRIEQDVYDWRKQILQKINLVLETLQK